MTTTSPSGLETHGVNVYTDGSVKSNVWGGCGWAMKDLVADRGFFGRAIALGREADVSAAELHGIRTAMEYLVERYDAGYGLGTHITFHTDCMHALNMLIDLIDTGTIDALRDGVLRSILALLQRLRDHGVGVYFGWLRRCSTPGSVAADDWAAIGSSASVRGRRGIMTRYGLGWGKKV